MLRHRQARKGQLPCTNSHKGWTDESDPVTFERVNGVRVPHVLKDRQPGDVAACWADPSLALKRLGWKTRRTLEDMCRDAWTWQRASAAG